MIADADRDSIELRLQRVLGGRFRAAIDQPHPRHHADAISQTFFVSNPWTGLAVIATLAIAGPHLAVAGSSTRRSSVAEGRERACLFHGPGPEVVFAKSNKDEMDALVEWIETCKDERIEEADICVLARTNNDVNEVSEALRARDIHTTILQPQKADDRRKSGVRMATMHRSKGLKFTAIAIVRVNDDTVPPKWLLNQAS